MKTRKTTKRILGLLLCAVLLLGIASPVADADELSTAVATPEFSTATSAEVVSLREENIKHFNMGNGIYQAIVYSHPVHELDDSSEYYLAYMALTLIHETAHTFWLEEQDKMEDDRRCDGEDIEGMQCVMEGYPLDPKDIGTFYEAIQSNNANAFCDGCAANLAALMREEGLIP